MDLTGKLGDTEQKDINILDNHHIDSMGKPSQHDDLGRKVAPALEGLQPVEIEMLARSIQAFATNEYASFYNKTDPLFSKLTLCIGHVSRQMTMQNRAQESKMELINQYWMNTSHKPDQAPKLAHKIAPILEDLQPVQVRLLARSLQAFASGKYDPEGKSARQKTYNQGDPLWAKLGLCIEEESAHMTNEILSRARTKQAE